MVDEIKKDFKQYHYKKVENNHSGKKSPGNTKKDISLTQDH